MREGDDVALLAFGRMVGQARAAAELLSAEGIECRVVDMRWVKPLDEDTITASVAKTGCCVVAEEHSVHGGLGSAVAECLARKNPAPCEFVGVQDRFGKSGEFEELLGYFNLDAAAIVEAVKRARDRK